MIRAPCPEISHLLLAALSQANTLGGSDGTIFWNHPSTSLTASDLTVTLPSSSTSCAPQNRPPAAWDCSQSLAMRLRISDIKIRALHRVRLKTRRAALGPGDSERRVDLSA